MANGGRKFTVFTSIYTLIQGLLWCLVAVYCVCVYNCFVDYGQTWLSDTKDDTFYYLLYISYLNGNSCGPEARFNVLAPSATRTFYWMCVYCVLSAIWIIVSLSLFASSLSNRRGGCGLYMYLPWLITTAIIAVTDAVAALFYVVDIFHTTTVAEYHEFIYGRSLRADLTGSDTAAPSVAMTLFFSRGIVFWLLNLALLYHVFKEARKISRMDFQDPECEDDDKFRTWNRPIISPNQLENTKREFQLEQEPKNWRGVALRREVPGAGNNGQSQITTGQSPYGARHESGHRVTYKLDEFGIPIEEMHSPKLAEDVRSPRPRTDAETPISRPISESHLLKRPSFRGVAAHAPSQELRGQVPWSYLQPSSPQQNQTHPVIPEPDYGIPTRSLAYPYVLSRPTGMRTAGQEQNSGRPMY